MVSDGYIFTGTQRITMVGLDDLRVFFFFLILMILLQSYSKAQIHRYFLKREKKPLYFPTFVLRNG